MNRYRVALLPGDDYASAGIDLDIGANYLLRLQTTFNTTTAAGLFFDQYAEDDFKFVILSAETDEVLIGHYTKRGGWEVDAAISCTISSFDATEKLVKDLAGHVVACARAASAGKH